MNDKQLKLIYEYMKEAGWRMLWDSKLCPLDSNTAWECVREMERKDESANFDYFYRGKWILHGKNCPSFTLWAMNPINFFKYMAEWLEEG